MTVFHRRVSGFCVVLILLALVFSPVAGFAAEKKAPVSEAQASMDKPEDLPAPELTIGARAGDGVNEGYGDILAPIFALKSGIVFVNPRATANDHSGEEYNLGFGYRHLLRDKGMIAGANIYYDHRETELGNSFNQVGFGVEYLSDWVDARANYYLPDDERESTEEEVVTETQSTSTWTEWGDPYAVGDTIYQNGREYKSVTTTTTKQRFIQYEEAMEGWDAEMGVRLPIPTVMDYADVKVFGGFYHYNRSFGLDDLDGFKGRVEIKAMPAVYLDAEMYQDKELTGHDYYLGARMSVPFDVANISKGRNPFEGAVDGMRIQKQKTTIASRLTEMVMRDLHVQTVFSEVEEEVEKREQTSTTKTEGKRDVSDTLASDVIFVNQDTGNDANPGTYEKPVAQIPTGIAMGNNVFVMATVGPYLLNLQIGKNVNLMGQGFPIGNDGKYLNGDNRFTVIKGTPEFFNNGKSVAGPTILVDGFAPSGIDPLPGANDVQIRGFDIQSELPITTLGQGESALSILDYTAVAVDSVQNFELAYNKLNNAGIGLGAVYGDMQDFNLNVHDNTFDTLAVGAGVVAVDSQGTFTFNKNTIQNTAIGLVAAAVGTDPLSPAVLNAQITGNTVKGGGLGIAVEPAFEFGGVDFQDLLPVDVGLAKGVDISPEDLPSVSALNVASLSLGAGSATVNATITGNHIEDNVVGIGAAGIGSNASVNATIMNNVLTGGGLGALILGTSFANVLPEETLDGSGIGIWMLGVNGAKLNNAAIVNNTITKHVLGIGVLGVGDAQMNDGVIANNTISDSLLGIVIAGIGENPTDFAPAAPVVTPVVQMNNWTISDNHISGNGVGQIISEILPIIPTNIIPENVNSALQQVNIPDTGVAGILVIGVAPQNNPPFTKDLTPSFYTTEMNGYQITGNTVENELLAVGVVGVGSDAMIFKESFLVEKALAMNGYNISGNTIRDNLVGILVGGVTFVDMQNYNIADNNLQGNVVGVAALGANMTDQSGLWIHNNTIVGGGLDDIAAALQPLADTNIIDDVDFVNLLKLPVPDSGAIGVVVLTDYADADGVSIDHNTISKNMVGALVVGFDESDINGLNVENNTISDSVMGLGVMAFGDTYINDSAIQNNVINDSALGMLILDEDHSKINDLTISGNTINRSFMGITAASWQNDAEMENLVISGNTISGANDPTKVGLLTAFLEYEDLTEDIEDIINQPWNPALFPNSGLEGVVVAPDGAGATSITISNNKFSNEAVAGLVNLENMPAGVPISYLNNTSSDGHFYVEHDGGSSFALTDIGNTPSPVIIIP